jgi:hypothetical protein
VSRYSVLTGLDLGSVRKIGGVDFFLQVGESVLGCLE